MDDVVMLWAFGDTRMVLDHSPLTHSFTRFLLMYSLKSNYTLYSYLPYLALLLFKVPFTHMFGIF